MSLSFGCFDTKSANLPLQLIFKGCLRLCIGTPFCTQTHSLHINPKVVKVICVCFRIMGKHYIQRPVGRAELRSLLELADAEKQAFFDRNPHLARHYRRRLLAIALCQGAANQYIRRGRGVNDFDVHFFYSQNPAKLRLSRTVKRIFATVGTFKKKMPVDFIRTVVPVPKQIRNSP